MFKELYQYVYKKALQYLKKNSLHIQNLMTEVRFNERERLQ